MLLPILLTRYSLHLIVKADNFFYRIIKNSVLKIYNDYFFLQLFAFKLFLSPKNFAHEQT